MDLAFTVDQFFEVFRNYTEAVQGVAADRDAMTKLSILPLRRPSRR